MDAVELKDLVCGCVGCFASMFGDLLGLYPGNVSAFFRDMKPKPVGFLRLYLVVTGIFFFFGYFLHFSESYDPDMALKVAFIYYLVAISLPLVIPYVLYLFDTRLVQRKVGYPEALTLSAYAFSFVLLSGIFRIHIGTWVLHLLAVLYSICLFYAALGERFGYERIIPPFIFLMLSGGLTALILFKILFTLLAIPPAYQGFSFFF